MSAGVLPRTVTGDYSLDDFLDAGEREDPTDGDAPDSSDEESVDASAEDESDPESVAEPDLDPDTEAQGDVTDEGESPAEEALDPNAVDPAEPTYDWSPDGAECAACGESTTTRWRQDGAYVCADCKEW